MLRRIFFRTSPRIRPPTEPDRRLYSYTGWGTGKRDIKPHVCPLIPGIEWEIRVSAGVQDDVWIPIIARVVHHTLQPRLDKLKPVDDERSHLDVTHMSRSIRPFLEVLFTRKRMRRTEVTSGVLSPRGASQPWRQKPTARAAGAVERHPRPLPSRPDLLTRLRCIPPTGPHLGPRT